MAEAQIERLDQPPVIISQPCSVMGDHSPPMLDPYDIAAAAASSARADIQQDSILQNRSAAPRPVKRKEVEARRFTGKENVEDYLLQFELTSKRNGWDDDEKSSALLCALDGQARGILAEFNDPMKPRYTDVKQSLLRRFGPTLGANYYCDVRGGWNTGVSCKFEH